MTPRFEGAPQFDLSLQCPLCGYKILPREICGAGGPLKQQMDVFRHNNIAVDAQPEIPPDPLKRNFKRMLLPAHR